MLVRKEKMVCNVGGKLAMYEIWHPKNHRVGGKCASRGYVLSRRIMCAAELKRLQFTCPPTSVHVGKTNDCSDNGSKCAVCKKALGGSGRSSRSMLPLWLADTGKVTQARRRKVGKAADARQQKERERINGLS